MDFNLDDAQLLAMIESEQDFSFDDLCCIKGCLQTNYMHGYCKPHYKVAKSKFVPKKSKIMKKIRPTTVESLKCVAKRCTKPRVIDSLVCMDHETTLDHYSVAKAYECKQDGCTWPRLIDDKYCFQHERV